MFTKSASYQRILSNVHNLGSGDVNLFSNDETVGRKDSNDVPSMLLYFFAELLPAEVTKLELFCDSCPGQNKNWTIIRFLHFMVHHKTNLSYPTFHQCKTNLSYPWTLLHGV